jgi:hypothetical protein
MPHNSILFSTIHYSWQRQIHGATTQKTVYQIVNCGEYYTIVGHPNGPLFIALLVFAGTKVELLIRENVHPIKS